MRQISANRIALPFFVLVWASLASALSAQTLEEVVARGVAALGGLEKPGAVRAIRMTGSITFPDGSRHPMTVELQRPGKIRTEIDFAEKGRLVQAFDGKSGSQVNPFSGSGAVVPMSPEEERNAREQADFDGPLVDWKARGLSLSLGAPAKVETEDAYEIRVGLPGGGGRLLYLSASTGRKIKWAGAVEQGGEKKVFETLFDDYRIVDGIPFPFRLRSRARGSDRTQVIAFEKIEVNPTIADSRFHLKPAALPTSPSPGKR